MKRSIPFSFIIFAFFLLTGCASGRSDNARFFNLQWIGGGAEMSEAHIDDPLKISFETADIPNNKKISVEIWEQTDGELKDFIAEVNGKVKNNAVEIEWVLSFDEENKNTNYFREIEENGFTFIDYVFVVKYKDKTAISKPLAVLSWIKRRLVNADTGEPLRNMDCFLILSQHKNIECRTDEDGWLKIRNLRAIGHYKIFL